RLIRCIIVQIRIYDCNHGVNVVMRTFLVKNIILQTSVIGESQDIVLLLLGKWNVNVGCKSVGEDGRRPWNDQLADGDFEYQSILDRVMCVLDRSARGLLTKD